MSRASVRAAKMAGVSALLLALFASQAPGAGAQGNADPGPPGNNGTVKLDGLDLLDGPGHTSKPNDPDEMETDNDPHLTCGFQLEFFNFDLGQLADIAFTAHAPTGTNGVLLAQQQVQVSDDGTGGAANDPDSSFDYDVLEDFDTTQFTSVHDVHGWHVKLDLTLYEADGTKVPGGQKHKVFWVEGCQPEPEPEIVTCPAGMNPPAGGVLVDGNGDGVAENCVTPQPPVVTCPAGMNPPAGGVLVDGNGDGVAENCVTPQPPVVTCPSGMNPPASGVLADGNGDGVAENCVTPQVPEIPEIPEIPVQNPPVFTPPAFTPPVVVPETPVEETPVVLPAVLVPSQPAAPAEALPVTTPSIETRVLPATAAAPAVLGSQTLPRTGTDATTTLALVGLGLLVTGATMHRRSARAVRAS